MAQGSLGRDERRLVIVDCDGVLVDSEPISNRLLSEEIAAAGLPVDAEEGAETFEGMRLGDIQAAVERWLDRPLPDVGSPISKCGASLPSRMRWHRSPESLTRSRISRPLRRQRALPPRPVWRRWS